MSRFILLTGAALGLSGVIAGALFDHAFPEAMAHAAETALRYHQLYALLIVALGLALSFVRLDPRSHKQLAITGLIFIAGTIVFCGSLYALAFTGLQIFAYLTPLGGLTLMAGWVALGVAALPRR